MFFKKENNKSDNIFIIKICALLIHAAKIDENYTKKEEEIIKKILLELGCAKEDLALTFEKAIKIEEDSNQILDFTKVAKSLVEKDKIKIVEALWSIIYSDKDVDIYEANMMRRLGGLLYIDNITMGNIKNKIKKENLK